MSPTNDPDWPAVYADRAADVVARSPTAAPLLAGFNVCVDALHRMDADRLAALAAARGGPDGGARLLVETVLRRLADGRGGEVFVDWPEGSAWIQGILGPPERHQIGGTGPQAAWAWGELGARAVVPLADRSQLQLDVLHPATAICTDDGVRPAARTAAADGPAPKPPHHILEFTAGTPLPSETGTSDRVPRSSRIILRFADDGIERDEAFAEESTRMCRTAYAGLLSGLNGLPDDERADRAWLRALIDRWRAAGLPLIHLELAEYASPAALRRVPDEYAGAVDSLGMSLSELRILLGGAPPRDPSEVVRDLAATLRVSRVCVHADDWALSIHRGEPKRERDALLTGNLLAAARAHEGAPTARPSAHPDATYAEDRPVSRALGEDWYADCVPAPYLPHPTSTIGLGDTFVAGLLLADSLRAHTCDERFQPA